jgi:hypothetical protein
VVAAIHTRQRAQIPIFSQVPVSVGLTACTADPFRFR